MEHEGIHAAIEEWMNFRVIDDDTVPWFANDPPIFADVCTVVANGDTVTIDKHHEHIDLTSFDGCLSYVNVRYRILKVSGIAASLHMRIVSAIIPLSHVVEVTNGEQSDTDGYDGTWLIAMVRFKRVDRKTREVEKTMWKIVSMIQTMEDFEERKHDVIGESVEKSCSGDEAEDEIKKRERRERARKQKQRDERERRSKRRERRSERKKSKSS